MSYCLNVESLIVLAQVAFTRTLCQVPLRSSVPGISHQSDRATQMVSMNSQSKNSVPRNSA